MKVSAVARRAAQFTTIRSGEQNFVLPSALFDYHRARFEPPQDAGSGWDDAREAAELTGRGEERALRAHGG